MVRHCDYNDAGPGSHTSDIVPGVLAIGEALHSTGSQCLAAIALGIEVMNALGHAEADSETKVANNLTTLDKSITKLTQQIDTLSRTGFKTVGVLA